MTQGDGNFPKCCLNLIIISSNKKVFLKYLACLINIFMAILNSVIWKASMFVTVGHFRPSLKFAGKAGVLKDSTLSECSYPCMHILDYVGNDLEEQKPSFPQYGINYRLYSVFSYRPWS